MPTNKKTKLPSPIDYILVFDEGKLDPGHLIVRASVSDGKKTVEEIGVVKIQFGFGKDVPEAINDFIRRNDSKLINRVFDVVGKK